MAIARVAAGAAVLFLIASPVARANDLECQAAVNGTTFFELDSFPASLHFLFTVKNIHPESASQALEATDEVLGQVGFRGFALPLNVPFKREVRKSFEVEVFDYEYCLELAALDGEADTFLDTRFFVRWDSGANGCYARVQCVSPDASRGMGRMTGGGSAFGLGRTRVTHGFQLWCEAADPRQQLEVSWGERQFHLLGLTSAECLDTALDAGLPQARFDTFRGAGVGVLDGADGATVEFTLTDAGEPGTSDRARIRIRDSAGEVVLDFDKTLQLGNHEAHP